MMGTTWYCLQSTLIFTVSVSGYASSVVPSHWASDRTIAERLCVSYGAQGAPCMTLPNRLQRIEGIEHLIRVFYSLNFQSLTYQTITCRPLSKSVPRICRLVLSAHTVQLHEDIDVRPGKNAQLRPDNSSNTCDRTVWYIYIYIYIYVCLWYNCALYMNIHLCAYIYIYICNYILSIYICNDGHIYIYVWF